jgi:hypothetical protein
MEKKKLKNLEDAHGTFLWNFVPKSALGHQAIAFYAAVGNESGAGSALEDDSPTCSAATAATAAPAGGDTDASTGAT